jgi:branched-chain amino acid transport system permease protein
MTAAVLGGVGDPRGALLGGLVLGIVASFSDYLLDAQWTPVLVLVLLIALLAFRPTGLLGRSASAAEPAELASRPVLAASRSHRRSPAILAGLLVVGLVYPWIDQIAGWYRLPSATMALLMVALAVGLTVVVGFAGLLDLGYAAFFAIGSYTAAILTSSGSRIALALPAVMRDPWVALLLAGIVAAGFGVIFGLPSVRTRGEYLAIVTLAFGEIVPLVIWHLPDWTGGPRGMSGIPAVGFGPFAFGPGVSSLPEVGSAPVASSFLAVGGLGSYAVALAIATLACITALRLSRSRLGRAWAAVREDDLAAGSLGINPPLVKLAAFALGAGFAGVAGAGFAQLFGYVEPSQFDFTVSLMVLAAVVLGGRWGVLGAVVGALGIALYDRVVVEALTAVLHIVGSTLNNAALQAADLRQHNFAVFGVTLFLATLYRARGEAPTVPPPQAELREEPSPA